MNENKNDNGFVNDKTAKPIKREPTDKGGAPAKREQKNGSGAGKNTNGRPYSSRDSAKPAVKKYHGKPSSEQTEGTSLITGGQVKSKLIEERKRSIKPTSGTGAGTPLLSAIDYKPIENDKKAQNEAANYDISEYIEKRERELSKNSKSQTSSKPAGGKSRDESVRESGNGKRGRGRREQKGQGGASVKAESGSAGSAVRVNPQIQPVKSDKPRREEKLKTQQVKKGGKKGPALKIIFLGGIGEIGKNMTALEYGNDVIVIDAGITFPDDQMPGIDLVIPDIDYLIKNRSKVRGLFLTHGHEDHIGGVPYLEKEIKVPVYGTKLTLALTDNKLRDAGINNVKEICIKPRDVIKSGCFEVECINVNHSIAGALAFSVRTPVGVVFISGDFKIDMTPIVGSPIDLGRIAEIGNEGVQLLLCESTNVEREGYTLSETVVGVTLDHMFAENASRRIIVATFASNVHRLQQILETAYKYNRKVVLSGRSMLNVVEAASRIGELVVPEGILVETDKIKNYSDEQLCIISTGSQGEPMSALTRMASGEFNRITIGDNDTIIISASPIPGNERMIYRVINNLYRQGARVLYHSLEKIHVSGHACQEELKILHNLLKPKFFIPVHGEYRHLKRHAELAARQGTDEGHVLIAEIGSVVELYSDDMRFGEKIEGGSWLVDGDSREDGDSSIIMRDRRHLAADGIIMLVFGVSAETREISGEIEMITKGLMISEQQISADVKEIIKNAVAAYAVHLGGDNSSLVRAIRTQINKYIFKKTQQNPMIVPVVLEV